MGQDVHLGDGHLQPHVGEGGHPPVELIWIGRTRGEVGIELVALDPDAVEGQTPLNHVGHDPGEQVVFVGDHLGVGLELIHSSMVESASWATVSTGQIVLAQQGAPDGVGGAALQPVHH